MKAMRLGSHGLDVSDLQKELRRFEPKLVDDGKFGWRTERAVRLAQRRLGLFPPDGIAGPRTMDRLASLSSERGGPNFSNTVGGMARKTLGTTRAMISSVTDGLSSNRNDIPPSIRNAVAPAAKRAEKGPMPSGEARPVAVMRMSAQGRLFIIRHETQPGVSNRLHHPTMGSGVTIGPGYDMKDRSRQTVTTDLEDLGIDPVVAVKAAAGAGLEGSEARAFVKENRQLLNLSNEKQTVLLLRIIGQYERMVHRAITVPLHQHEFDALVSYTYNPGGGWRKTTALVNAGKPAEAMVELSRHVYSKRQMVHSLVVRREAESRMYLYGEYL